MKNGILMSFAVLVLACCISAAGLAQGDMKQSADKMKEHSGTMMKKADVKTADVKVKTYSVQCDPGCGFMVRSHDKDELTSIVINHMKTAHNKDITAADVEGMIRTREPGDMKGMMKESKDMSKDSKEMK